MTTGVFFQLQKLKQEDFTTMQNFAEVSHTLELDFPTDIEEIALEHGEDPNKTCELMQELKDMIYERGDCNPHRMDDEFLIKFLRARYWKVENAHKLVSRVIQLINKASQKSIFFISVVQIYKVT